MSMTMFVFGYSEQLLWTCQSLIELILVENKSHVLSCPINFGLLGKWWVPTITAFEKDQGFCQHQDNNIRMIFANFSWWMLFVRCIVGCCFAGCCCVLTTISPLGFLNPPCVFALGDVGPTWRLNPLRDVGLAQDSISLNLLGMNKNRNLLGGHSYWSKTKEDIHFLDVEPMAIFRFLNVQDMFAGNLGRRRFITFANLSLSRKPCRKIWKLLAKAR